MQEARMLGQSFMNFADKECNPLQLQVIPSF